MSINKLNLQIGGNKEVKEDSLLEEVGLSFVVDDLLEELVEDKQEEIIEEHGDFLVKALSNGMPEVEPTPVNENFLMESLGEAVDFPIPKAPEPELSRQERMAESLSAYNKKTRQSLEEVAPVSDTDRISLLEDAFAQMKRGRPQTLVSGIGASLDSGGGAVWLWDLEDVSIGAPYNSLDPSNPGTKYPNITDGSFLSYNAAAKVWQAVEDSGAANALSGAVIKATGGSANASGNLVIEATDATDGNFTIKNASAAEKFVIDGSTGDTTVKGGHVVIERRTTGSIGSSTFTIQGRATDSPNDPVGILFSTYNSHPMDNGTADSIRYAGRVSNNKDITTKQYVDEAVAGAVPGGNFDFKGTTDVTGTPPSNPSGGDFYINTVAGVATNDWTGIATLTIAADQLVLYSSTESRWFAGSIEGANPNVLKIGDTMTGPLTIDIPSDASSTDAFRIKQGGVTKAEIFSGGAATFNNTITCQNILSHNLKPRTDNTYVLGDTQKSWSSAYINTINTTAVVNTGTLDVSGNTNLGTATAGTRIVLGNANMVGNTSTPTYEFEGGKSANIKFDRCTDNSMSFPQIVIEGKTTANDGVKTNDLLTVTRESGNTSDIVKYYGNTGSGNAIQNRSSLTSYVTGGGYTITGGLINFDGATTGLRFKNINNNTNAILTTSFTGTNPSQLRTGYILFGGSGQDGNDTGPPGQIIVARQTVISDVSESRDVLMKFHVPQSNLTTGMKTEFLKPVVARQITLQDTTSSSLSNFLLNAKDQSGTQTFELMAEKGHVLLQKPGAELEVVRADTSSGDTDVGGVHIKGCTVGNSLSSGKLFYSKYYADATTGSLNGDAVMYEGRTSESKNIQNKDSVNALIDTALTNPVAWSQAYGTGGGLFDNSSYISYRIINNNTVQLIVRLSNGGANIAKNEVSFGATSNFETVLSQSVCGAFQVITKDGEVLQATINITTKGLKIAATESGNGSQDVQGWAFLPYGKP